jgi:hypothetical protein
MPLDRRRLLLQTGEGVSFTPTHKSNLRHPPYDTLRRSPSCLSYTLWAKKKSQLAFFLVPAGKMQAANVGEQEKCKLRVFFRSQGETAGVKGAFAPTRHDTQTEGDVVYSDSGEAAGGKEALAVTRHDTQTEGGVVYSDSNK